VLQVRDGQTPERLIPFVAAFIDQVDLASRRIDVDWGLDY
jgi:16S rRNA processing protein RimM